MKVLTSVGSNKPTNLNERDAGYSMRELDFFLVRTMVKVNRFFKGFLSYFRVYREETKAEILPGANLFNTSYASDHLPVVMTYELKVEYKGIAKLFHNFLQLFRRNPPAEQTPVQMLATEEL